MSRKEEPKDYLWILNRTVFGLRRVGGPLEESDRKDLVLSC